MRVQFVGGREVVGTLTGYDQLMNLVLEQAQETLRDPATNKLTTNTRSFPKVVVRGPLLLTILPVDGSGFIENPFAQQQ